MAPATRKKNYLKMTVAELAKETAQFDEEFVADKSRPLTEEQRERWNRAKRKPGRPRIGDGAVSICLSVERTVLTRADEMAHRLGVTRAKLFSDALVAFVAAEKIDKKKPRLKKVTIRKSRGAGSVQVGVSVKRRTKGKIVAKRD